MQLHGRAAPQALHIKAALSGKGRLETHVQLNELRQEIQAQSEASWPSWDYFLQRISLHPEKMLDCKYMQLSTMG